MKERLAAFVCGGLFAAGLSLSGMVRPSKVIGFLDFTGHWDPTLAFVMSGALAVFVPCYRWALRRGRPVLVEAFDVPSRTDITWQLVVGAAVFGIGWAVSGFCPAAAIAALPALGVTAIAAALGMAVGLVGTRVARRAIAQTAPIGDASADF